jgi:diguanylate cyclase
VRRRVDRPVVAVLVAVAVFAVFVRVHPGGARAARAVDDVGQLFAAAVAAVSCLWRARRSTSRARVTWTLLGGATGSWALGETAWSYYELLGGRETPFPSVADAGFLLFSVLAVVGLLLWPSDALRGGARWRGLLDGVLVAGALFIVTWVTALGSVVRGGGDSPFAFAVSLSYPVSDLVLLTLTILVVAQARQASRSGLGLLAVGLACLCVGDSGFAYLSAVGRYATGSPVDAAWFGGFLLIAAAAYRSTKADHPEGATTPLESTPKALLPYLPAIVGLTVAVSGELSGRRDQVALTAATLVVAALLGRQLIAVLDNRRLVRQLVDAELDLRHQAFHDPLTGLANRALFADRLDHAVALQRRDLRPLAVLCLDLDDFKLVNDSLGHPAGDDLLVRVAERLLGCLRGGDTVARLGGDEFAVLIEEGADVPLVVADRVVEAFRAPFMIEGHPLTVRPSIGLASASPDTAEVSGESLLKHADVAMYAAKRAGAGGVHLFRPDMHLADVDELSLRQDLTRAVASGRIEVAYQPIVDVATGEIRGAEALARWNHPVHGPIPPLRFIPMAEQAGLVVQLGLQLLDLALAEFAGWIAPVGSPPLRLAVNLSAQQLIDPGFPGQVKALLDRHRIPATQLILEITEGQLLTRVEAASVVAAALDASGVQLALDDFGVGYSSLAHLTTFPLRVLKIDRAFVDPLDTRPEHRDFFAALLQLGRSLGLEIVAEGVERPEQLAELRVLGCDLAQGYYLGRPADGATFRGSLARQFSARTSPWDVGGPA